MGLASFLAMTAAEIAGNRVLPPKTAWMACHFSPYGPGLSNLPRALPPGSLLMVDDATPIRNHDPQVIREQLHRCAKALDCRGIFLDFQRPKDDKTASLVEFLSDSLPCPVAVSHIYADNSVCALCIPPVPPSEPPESWFSRWKDKELWLELSREGEQITVTEQGAAVTSLPFWEARETDFHDENLLCHYRQEVQEDAVVFTLYRTQEDQLNLLDLAEKHGITTAVGLYQEFHAMSA
jgi:hypothetical protein